MSERSLVVFASANLDFAVDFLNWVSEWCAENEWTDPQIRNTPSGGYEVLATPLVALAAKKQ